MPPPRYLPLDPTSNQVDTIRSKDESIHYNQRDILNLVEELIAWKTERSYNWQTIRKQKKKKRDFYQEAWLLKIIKSEASPTLKLWRKKSSRTSAFSSITCAMQSPLDGHPSHHPNPLDLFVLWSSCPLPYPQIWCSCSTVPWPQHNIHVHFLVLAPLCCGLDRIDRYIKHVVNIKSTCFWKLETLTYKLKVVQK